MPDAVESPPYADPVRERLVQAMRHLNLIVATTGAGSAELARAAAGVSALARRLARQRLSVTPAPTFQDAVGAPSYISSLNNPALPAVPMTFDQGEARAVLQLNETYQGPRGSVHGGVLACLMDTLLASLVQQRGFLCVTAGLDIRYRFRTPLHRPLQLHARLQGVEGRKVRAIGTITADQQLTVEASGVFVEVPQR